MPKSLADGHEKVTILAVAPAIPGVPTIAELNAGIDASLNILASDWTFGPSDSETFSERAVGESLNPQAYGVSNGQFGMTLFRYFTSGGIVDTVTDTAYAAVKVKGTTVWIYARKNGKLASAAWATGDVARYGAEVLTDRPQDTSAGGYIKNRVSGQVQHDWTDIAISA